MSRVPWSKAACAGAIAFALARGALAAPVAANDPHTLALAALHDLRAAISSIIAAEQATSSGPAEYKHDAQRAINALAGPNDDAYDAKAGSDGDAGGVLPHLDALLDRTATPPWVPAIHGVQANTRAALGSLEDAMQADGLDTFEVKASQALLNLEVALGRGSDPGVLGGLLGAMASTELGVPAKAARLNACDAPTRPGYGVHGGYWVWQALRLNGRTQTLSEPGGTHFQRKGNMLIYYTPAAQLPPAQCTVHAAHAAPQALLRSPVETDSRGRALLRVSYDPAEAAPRVRSAVWHPAPQDNAQASGWMPVALKTGAAPPYTAAQAHAGQPIYEKHCSSCHGADLQGVAAPAIAGHDFVSTAQKNGWTMGILRTIVTENMPFNDPGALSPKQYADVIAYLLAANCYTAGKAPFPLHHIAALDTMHLPDPPGAAQADAHGVCKP